MTSTRAAIPVAAFFALGAPVATGCTAEVIGDDPGEEPSPRPDAGAEPPPNRPDGAPDGPDEPVGPEDPPEEFDPDDPHAYVWTARALAYDTLPLLYGTVRVDYAWAAAGMTDPEGDERALQEDQLLVEDVSFDELMSGRLSLRTYRDEDGLPTTYCAKAVEGAAAVTSRNAIAEHGYPELASSDFTDPDQYRDYVGATPGVVMIVDGDCSTVHDSNPREQRSVLSWLAVTFEARPHPDLIDPDDPPDGEGTIGMP